MAKEKMSPRAILYGILGSLTVYMLVQLLLALAMVKGWVGEERMPMLQTGSALLASWIGCAYAVRHSAMKRALCAALVSGGFAAAILLLCVLCYEHVGWGREAALRLAAILCGGAAASLPGQGRGKRPRRKR